MQTQEPDDKARAGEHPPRFKATALCRSILKLAVRGQLAQDFMREVSKMIVDFCRCDAVEIRVVDRDKLLRCEAELVVDEVPDLDIHPARRNSRGDLLPVVDGLSPFEKLYEDVSEGRSDSQLPVWTLGGSLRMDDTKRPVTSQSGEAPVRLQTKYRFLAIVPFVTEEGARCLLIFKSGTPAYLRLDQVEAYEDTAKMLGIAWSQRRAQIALRLRVRELTCLFGISKLASTMGVSLSTLLEESPKLLRRAWLYQDVASACIEFDGHPYTTVGYKDTPFMQEAPLVIDGTHRGTVKVAYSKKVRELDEGPFLKEERELIEVVASELALIIESKQKEEEAKVLQEQLRHADRLATIGNLAAGVAHELNEPLASILGRAQLIEKMDGVPAAVLADNAKIVTASLHAREIISKLRLFARQKSPRKERVNLNHIVRDGLFLVERRCEESGVALVQRLAPELPTIVADPDQLYQVLVNLVVNAVQATASGGRITIETLAADDGVVLAVEDNGCGMDEDVLKQAFTPFFTTKESEGTGLGLAVVHGIVTSHGGTIGVESRYGHGSRFEVRLPFENPTTERSR